MGKEGVKVEEGKVTPSVYMAALLDEANEHLIEVKELLKKQESLSKKSVPFNTGQVSIPTALLTQPADPSGYTVTEDVYAKNNNQPIEKMQFINDGPGNIFFVVFENSQTFSNQEETLGVGERRPLYNVFQVKLRTDIPLTQYRLVEGELLTGSFARNYKNFVENRIVLQPNEINLTLQVLFDTDITQLKVVKPTVAAITVPACGACVPVDAASCCFTVDNSLGIRQDPLTAGKTAAFIAVQFFAGINTSSQIASLGFSAVNATLPAMLPFTIPAGFIAEGFVFVSNFTTNATIKNWAEVVAGSGKYTLLQSVPISSRGSGLNEQLNINYISTQFSDPTGAPSPGRKFLVTVTNDDSAASMSGFADFEIILRRLT